MAEEIKQELVEVPSKIEIYSRYNELIDSIKDESESITTSFMRLGCYLKEIKEKNMFEIEGYANIEDFAKAKFGYSSTSTKNFIAVCEKYSSEDDHEELDDEYSGYSFTALVELLPVPKKDIKKTYKESMTVKEIRETKFMSQLTDELKEEIERRKLIGGFIQCAMEDIFSDIPKKYKLPVIVNITLNEDKTDFDVCNVKIGKYSSLSWVYFSDSKKLNSITCLNDAIKLVSDLWEVKESLSRYESDKNKTQVAEENQQTKSKWPKQWSYHGWSSYDDLFPSLLTLLFNFYNRENDSDLGLSSIDFLEYENGRIESDTKKSGYYFLLSKDSLKLCSFEEKDNLSNLSERIWAEVNVKSPFEGTSNEEYFFEKIYNMYFWSKNIFDWLNQSEETDEEEQEDDEEQEEEEFDE